MTQLSTPSKIGAALVILIASIVGGVRTMGHVRPSPAAHTIETPRLIDLNTANAGELQLLSRIGPTLAERIIEDRQANGPYRTLESLQRVRGIGPVTVRRLQGLAEARPIR